MSINEEEKTVIVIKAGDYPSVKKMALSLSDMQNIVGGYIEVVYPF